jgi:hypothetical protein
MSWLGKPTIEDEIALLASKDRAIGAVVSAFGAYQPTWLRKDGAAMAAWLKDWGAFWQRWSKARADAKAEILAAKINLTPNDRLLAAGYNGLLRALSREPGHIQTGDFANLYQRLVMAGAHVDEAPGEVAAHDVDRDLYAATNKAAGVVEHAPVVGPAIAAVMTEQGLGRGTADTPDESQRLKSKLTIAAILAGVLGGTILILRR